MLVLNPGSSTLKGSLVALGMEAAPATVVDWPQGDDDVTATATVRRIVDQLADDMDAVGYRVVHGGMAYRAAAHVDAGLVTTVEELDALAPLHNRRAAAVMRAGMDQVPGIPHVACFDTAFHADLPEHAWRYALPADWVERWQIRRFGFHGLSVAWSIRRAAELLGRSADNLRLVIAHLGAGCSITAVEGGRSVATSMGFTPLEGPMMATRSGSVDPGVLLHLLREGMSPEDLADGLSNQSGLRAMSGTADIREIEERADRGDAAAHLALRMFARQVSASIAGVATALGNVDALIFTGGIGEHSKAIRSAVAERLTVLSVPRELRAVDQDEIAADGPPAVVVIRAREDLVIADEVATLLAASG